MIDINFNYYWKIGFNQIYPYLKQLEENEFVIKEEKKSSKGPNQILYSITQKGIDQYFNWLNEDIQTTPTFKNEVLVKLNFGSSVSYSDNINLLTKYKKVLETRYESIMQIKKEVNEKWQDHNNVFYWNLVLDYGLIISNSEISWCDDSLKQLEGLL